MTDMFANPHPGLALLALGLMVVVCYHGLDLAVRLAASEQAAHRRLWYTVGPPMAGLGLWAADLVTLLSWLRQPMSRFDPLWSLGAYVFAVGCCGGILWFTQVRRLDRPAVVPAAGLLCMLVVLMHYLNLASVGVDIFHQLGAGYLVLTIGCVVVALSMAVSVMRLSRHPRRHGWFVRRLVTAGLMALVASALFHTAIAAAILPQHLSETGGDTSSLIWLGGTVGVGALLLELTVVALTHQCTRLFLRAQRLTGSLSQLNDEIRHLATHDALTGLPNRHTLVRAAKQAVRALESGSSGRPPALAVLYLDLDGFKAVNDTYGHEVGDQLLCQVPQRLEHLLPLDRFARVGGDEFVAVLLAGDNHGDIEQLAQTVIETIQQVFVVQGTDLRITASIGIACQPHGGDSVEALIASADVAMYEAKAHGRNQYRFHDLPMRLRARRLVQIQRGLQTALSDGTLALAFQPKHDALSGRVVGVEALARWRHPELGEVSPAEFIGVAERSGQILRLGEWVLDQACAQLQAWRAQGLELVRVAINLSPLQLVQPDLLDRVSAIAKQYSLQPAHLMFEVTESMAMQDAEHTTAVLRDFRQRGFEFAIDDFGTGYSSLAYLQKFRAHQLKIDRCFVEALDEGGTESLAIITAIIVLAHTLGMVVVAEGVESASQAEHLRTLGCNQLQGYLMSRPMSSAAFARDWLNPAPSRQPARAPPHPAGFLPAV